MSNKEYRKYFGKRFYQQKDGYWVNMMPIHAHRWVWINHYGAIPTGMDIHHKDGDKSNNEIENLEMLSRSDHLKKHWECPELRKERRKFLDKMRPKVHEYLRSPEGRKKQSEISKNAWSKRKNVSLLCKNCDKEFTSTQTWAKFCCQNCYMKYTRKTGKYNVVKKCLTCDKEFITGKWDNHIFCSISCGAKSSSKKRNIVKKDGILLPDLVE